MAVCSCPVYRKKPIVIKPKYLQTFPFNWMPVNYFYFTVAVRVVDGFVEGAKKLKTKKIKNDFRIGRRFN